LELPPRLLILIPSRGSRSSGRSAVRRTWKPTARKSGITVAFLVWESEWTDRLAAENRSHADLFTMPVDRRVGAGGWRELSAKTIAALTWAAQEHGGGLDPDRPPAFDFVLKTDDDAYPIIPNILRAMTAWPRDRFMCGHAIEKGWVWTMGEWENRHFRNISGYDSYPLYYAGAGYFMSRDVVLALSLLDAFELALYRWPMEDAAVGAWLLGFNFTRAVCNVDPWAHHLAKWTCSDQSWLVFHHAGIHLNLDDVHKRITACKSRQDPDPSPGPALPPS
jgi:hypothetical protein